MMLPTQNEYRITAETLLASTSGYHSYGSIYGTSQNPDLSNSHSINTISSIRPEIVISEDLISGQRINGTMSNIRRFFCLFVTFDVLLTCLMWIICIMLDGDNLYDALKIQILHYDIKISLFDVVMVAICRFTVLLLFYAVLYINHWIVISLSTAGTCIFLICKVFVFDWTLSHQPVFEVLLILASFILAWSEAWFLDFRVIPHETHARRYLVTTETERTPLVRNYIQSLPSQYTESVGNFYSPLQSPEGSLHGSVSSRRERVTSINLTQEEEQEMKRKAGEIKEEAWRTVNNPEWKVEKISSEGDTVETISLNTCVPATKTKKGKLFRLTGVVNAPPKYLLDEFFYRLEDMPIWNNAVIECSKLCIIDEHTDISYQISPESGSGMISSRDFIILRHWGIIDGCFVIAFASVEHPDLPARNGLIRGENNIGCFVMRPINDEPNKCVFQWLLSTNLKGWIPQYIIDSALTGVMLDYLRDLRGHAAKLKQAGKIK